MAEGFARSKFPHDIKIWSAGSNPAERVNPRAVEVMAEVGIDISHAQPTFVGEVPGPLDMVITLCSSAAQNCPSMAAAAIEHWDLDDPAEAIGNDDELMQAFRQSRDDIERRIVELADRLPKLIPSS